MKSMNDVIKKYKEIFGIEKDYLEILRECHKNIINFKEKSFTLWDFKNDNDFKENLSLINNFRKYAVLDDFLLGVTNYSLMSLEDKNNFKTNITYHDVMDAIDLFEEKFNNMKSFYIPNNLNVKNNKLVEKRILTINDIFNYENESNFTLYFIESSEKYYFSVTEEGYDYLYELPFKEIENNEIVMGYLYLITEYVSTSGKDLLKEKSYTTITKHFGKTYEAYLNNTEPKGRYGVFERSLKPFLIEEEGLSYNPASIMTVSGITLFDLETDKKTKEESYYEYFKHLDIDKSKVNEYVENNWIQNYDIGRYYDIDFNMVCTKEELDNYRELIIKQKIDDILLNFYMYKKHGLYKYNSDKSRNFLEDYSSFLKEYLFNFETVKKEFNTDNDKRIDLDENDMFTVGRNENRYDKYSNNSFKHFNILLNDYKVFTQGEKSIQIQVNLEKFIEIYNEYKNENILNMDYDWYFPYKQLEDYVENNVRPFSLIRLTSGVRREEFSFLKDVLFLEGKERKQILNHVDFIEDAGRYHIQSRNEYYFEIPVVLNMHMDIKEFDKIKKGNHPIFKSKQIEDIKKDEDLKFLTSERFLSKKEVSKLNDLDVVYTKFTHKELNLFKGIKGKIISIDKEIIIEDELGNIHTESFRSIGKSGWVHISTTNYNEIYNKLSLKEKSFIESLRKPLIEMDKNNQHKLTE